MQASIFTLTIEFGLPIVQIPSVTTINLEPITVIFFFLSFIYTRHDHRHAQMSTCNLASLVHNKWLQQSGHKWFVFTKAQWMISSKPSCKLQNIGHVWNGCTVNCHDSTSLNLKAMVKCEDPRPMAKAMEYYLRANGLNTKAYALKGTKLFGFNKQKLSFSLGSKCDSHRFENVLRSLLKY